MTVKSNTTVVLLEFHSWANGQIAMEAGSPLTALSASPAGPTSLVNYHFEKRLGAPTGAITLVMKGEAEGCYFSDGRFQNGEPWLNLLDEGDWWAMSIQRNGQKLFVGMGKIDLITIDLAQDRGATISTITVRGRDLGFGLQDVPVYFNPFDAAAQNIVGIDMLQFIGGQGGFAGDVVRGMIEGMFGFRGGDRNRGGSQLYGSAIRIPLSLRNRVGFDKSIYFNLVEFQIQPDLEGQVVIPQPVLNVQQSDTSVWDYASTWRNPLMNELFVDIDPAVDVRRQKAKVILREKPFVNAADGQDSPWFDLPVIEIDAKTCAAVNLTKGMNRVNHLLVLGDLTGVFGDEVYGIHPPAFNNGSVERYGLRRRTEQTNYFEELGVEASEQLLKQWRARILNWNVLNQKYLQGRITIAEARADIRVGQKIAIINGPFGNYRGFDDAPGPPTGSTGEQPYDTAYTFYVEAVRYEGTFGAQPRHMTTLEVSRGYPERDRVVDIIAESQPWADFSAAAFQTSPSKNTDKRNLSQNSADPEKPAEGTQYDPSQGGT